MYQATIVIPNYNGEKYLNQCLKSIPFRDDIEVIVVDNGSKDKSISFVKEKFPYVRIIQNLQNEGFSVAVNEGIRSSEAPYVILLNNDTEIEENFIDELLYVMRQHPGAFSGSSCMVQMANPTQIDDTGDYYSSLGWAFTVGKGKNADCYKKQRNIFASCAGAAIYRKEVFNQIGYFDENHFAYLEDIDIGYRSQIFGWKNVYIPKAICKHVGSGFSGSRYNSFKIKLSAQNSIYLIYKNMPFFFLLLNLPFLVIGYIIKLLFFILKGYGKDYIAGLKAGFILSASSRGKLHKVKFQYKNFGHYCKIQGMLWFNMIRRLIY